MSRIRSNATGSEATRSRATTGRARLSDVAVAAAVSTATVSRSFNEPDKVSPEIRARVLLAARRLGWIPNAAGRALASNRTHIVGAIIPTLDDEIFASLVSGMQATLAQHGMTLFLGCSSYDPSEELRHVQAMLARGVEGVAVVGEAHRPELFEALASYDTPYVVTYGWRPGSAHPAIGFDNRAAYVEMTEYLVSLGHRNFGAIFQPSANNDRVQDRIAGMHDALRQHGCTLAHDCIYEAERGIEGGRRGLNMLLNAGSGLPTAIVCGNDHLAVGVILEAAALGIRVPNDLSVTGFDDIDLARQLRPSLTTMRVDTHRIGQVAADYVVARLNGDDPAVLAPIKPSFHVRASTSTAPRQLSV